MTVIYSERTVDHILLLTLDSPGIDTIEVGLDLMQQLIAAFPDTTEDRRLRGILISSARANCFATGPCRIHQRSRPVKMSFFRETS